MITNWYDYTVAEIKNIFENLGYNVMVDNDGLHCIVGLEDERVGYFARSPNQKIEKVMVLDDEKGRWR